MQPITLTTSAGTLQRKSNRPRFSPKDDPEAYRAWLLLDSEYNDKKNDNKDNGDGEDKDICDASGSRGSS